MNLRQVKRKSIITDEYELILQKWVQAQDYMHTDVIWNGGYWEDVPIVLDGHFLDPSPEGE